MNIDNDIELPEETEVATPAKPRKTRATKVAAQPKPAANIIEALKFVALAQKKTGDVQHTHCFAVGGWLAASDGIATLATPISDNLNCCPNTMQLIKALEKCGYDLNISQMSAEALSIKSENFHALIPCVPQFEIKVPGPDDNVAVVDESLRKAIFAVSSCVKKINPNPVFQSVLVQSNTVVALNGHVLMEAWHGIHLPDGLLMPASSAKTLMKIKKPLTGFGFSKSSITFYFADGAWFKTQLYGEAFPNYQPIINVDVPQHWQIPSLFFTALKMVLPFSNGGGVYFKDGTVQTGGVYQTKEHREGASYQMVGLPDDYGFDANYLLMLDGIAETAHFQGYPDAPKMYFFGGIVRGVVMGLGQARKAPERDTRYEGRVEEKAPPIQGVSFDENGDEVWEDDIPF